MREQVIGVEDERARKQLGPGDGLARLVSEAFWNHGEKGVIHEVDPSHLPPAVALARVSVIPFAFLRELGLEEPVVAKRNVNFSTLQKRAQIPRPDSDFDVHLWLRCLEGLHGLWQPGRRDACVGSDTQPHIPAGEPFSC